MNLTLALRIGGIVVIVLSVLVAIPLAILTADSNGGPWGFGMVGLGLLLPVSGYILFGIAGVIKAENTQRWVFIAGHVVTIVVGFSGMFLFPVYPMVFAIGPVLLAIVGILGLKKFRYFVLLMMIISILINVVLLKWEIDFGRTLPALQLLEYLG